MDGDQYKLKVKVELVNQRTGEVEDTTKTVTRKVSAANASKMRAPLIDVFKSWNHVGVEGTEAAPDGAKTE